MLNTLAEKRTAEKETLSPLGPREEGVSLPARPPFLGGGLTVSTLQTSWASRFAEVQV